MTVDRDHTIYVARGVAIIAIVLGHAQRGLVASGIIDGGSAQLGDSALYMVHLSVFAFLAGLFVKAGVERKGTSTYLRQRATMILYLYVLWVLLQGSVSLVLSSFVNHPKSPGEVLTLWEPADQFWFFPWLLLMTVGAALLKPWLSLRRSQLTVIGALVLSLACWGLNGNLAGTQGLGLTVFFFAGVIITAPRLTTLMGNLKGRRGIVALVITGPTYVVLVLLGATPPTTGGDSRGVLSVAEGVVASTAGLIAVLIVCTWLSRTRALQFIGQRSMEIFLAHILATAGVRILLVRVGIESPAVHLVAAVVIGVSLPLAIWAVTRKVGAPWVFSPLQRLMYGKQKALV